MRQYLFSVLKSLGHLSILVVQGSGQGVFCPLSLQAEIGHFLQLTGKDDFGLVCEVHLDDLVAEPEHDGMLGLHPLLDEAVTALGRGLFGLGLAVRVEVVPEMLQ
jgi:hypothetical protein